MLKRILAARKHVAIGLAVGLAAVALCAGADEARIRHMADTYLQSDGTQIIDTGYIASTNMRVEVVFTPLESQYSLQVTCLRFVRLYIRHPQPELPRPTRDHERHTPAADSPMGLFRVALVAMLCHRYDTLQQSPDLYGLVTLP